MSKTPEHTLKTILLKPFKDIPSIPSLFSVSNQVPQWGQSLTTLFSKIPVWLLFLVIAIPILLKVLMQLTCYSAKPIELFTDVEEQEQDNKNKFKQELSNAESSVCKLITRVDSFIRNDIGHAGIENPSLITDAQSAARKNIDMVSCNNENENENDIDHRLTRLEETLRSFTGVELQKTYQKTMTCEEFLDGSNEPEQKEKQTIPRPEQNKRLRAIQELLAQQEQKLLLPIDQKTEDLKKGIVSDCDKKRAATHLSQLKKN